MSQSRILMARFRAWSLFEHSPDLYKVFVLMTKGEQTAFCNSPGYDADTGEEPRRTPSVGCMCWQRSS